MKDMPSHGKARANGAPNCPSQVTWNPELQNEDMQGESARLDRVSDHPLEPSNSMAATIQSGKQARHFDWKEFLDRSRNIATISATLIACFALLQSCRTSLRTEEANYLAVGLANRPRLVVAQPITISRVEVKEISLSTQPDNNISVSFSIVVHSRIRLKNEAPNAIASIHTVITTGATEKYASAKAIALGLHKPTEVRTIAFPRFQQLQVLPMNSVTFPVTQDSLDGDEFSLPVSVSTVKQRTFLLNYMVYYVNEYGNLYHTHVKAPFALKPLDFNSDGIPTNEVETRIREFLTDQLVSQKAFEPLPVVQESEMYSYSESKTALAHLRTANMQE